MPPSLLAALHSARWLKEMGVVPTLQPLPAPYHVHDNPNASGIGRYFLADNQNESLQDYSANVASFITRRLYKRGPDGTVRCLFAAVGSDPSCFA